MRLGLSSRGHLPVLKTDNVKGYSFSLLQWRQVRTIEKSGLHLTGISVRVFLEELRYDARA